MAITKTSLASNSASRRSFDGLSRFVTLLRWVTTAVGVGWSTLLPFGWPELGAVVGLLLYSIFRSFFPFDYREIGWKKPWPLLVEIAVSLAAVSITGTWTSPFIFALFTPVVVAGFARGQNYASFIAAFMAAALEVLSLMFDNPSGTREVITWTGELLLIAVVASYGRTLLTRVEAATVATELQAQKLSQANALLANLDRLATDLSVSFDFQDAIRTSVLNIRALVPFGTCVLLINVVDSETWDVALAEGVALGQAIETDELPSAVDDMKHTGRHETRRMLADTEPGDGRPRSFDAGARDGLYVPLYVAERFVGLIALERTDAEFTLDEQRVAERMSSQIALNVDNARWFERLQARGAARERIRLARDLHDRLGQGIAYVAFELDRLSALSRQEPISDQLDALRDDARSTVKELRETLSDLRTDVSLESSLSVVLAQFLERVELRSGVEVSFDGDSINRIDLGQEQEIWRIAQEAIVNAERHADASKIHVSWDASGATAVLIVEDDGVGIDEARLSAPSLGRPSYGVTGMRERAGLLGASLFIEPAEGKGTRVRLQLSTNAYASPLSTESASKNKEV